MADASNREELLKSIEKLQAKIDITKRLLSDEHLLDELKDKLKEVNRQQDKTFAAHPENSAAYIAHGTHMAPENFLTTSVDGKQYCPVFAKETQNELTAIRGFREQHQTENSQDNSRKYENVSEDVLQKEFKEKQKEMGLLNSRLQSALGIPPRLFGIPTKTEEGGKPVTDESGVPVPQDGSYAYSIKKCAGIIKFTEDNEPVLIGTEDKFKNFEEGTTSGHIYIVDGRKFKPEYGAGGQVTEYTTQERPELVRHLTVTPKDAMAHNAQIIMFRSDELFDDWSRRVAEKFKGGFDFNIKKDSPLMAMLAEEVRAGRAVYINATDRGMNPRVPVLRNAQAGYNVREKIEKRNNTQQGNEQTAVEKPAVRNQGNVSGMSKSSLELG